MISNSLGAFINAVNSNGNNEIILIEYDKAIPHDNNFYELRDVDKLSEEIKFSDFVDPLQVRSLGDGTYRLISGHKRRAAIGKLMSEAVWPLKSFPRGMLPCIVRTIAPANGLSLEDVELCNLIFSNKGQRDHYTVQEQLKEIELLQPIARKIYDNDGKKDNPGGFRNYFAEQWLFISGSELQRLQSFSKLTKEAMNLFDQGFMSKCCAAEMAIMPAERQMELIDNFHASGSPEGFFTLSKVKDFRKMAAKMDDLCNITEDKNEGDEDSNQTINEDKTADYENGRQKYEKSRERKKNNEKTEMVMPLHLVPSEIQDAQSEAEDWEKKMVTDFYCQLYNEAVNLSETEEESRERAQWGIRAAFIRMKLLDLGIDV